MSETSSLVIKYLLLGGASGLASTLLIVPIIKYFKNMSEKKRIHKAILEGKILKPIDVRDYNSQEWKEKRNLEIPTNEDLNKLELINQQIKARKEKENAINQSTN